MNIFSLLQACEHFWPHDLVLMAESSQKPDHQSTENYVSESDQNSLETNRRNAGILIRQMSDDFNSRKFPHLIQEHRRRSRSLPTNAGPRWQFTTQPFNAILRRLRGGNWRPAQVYWQLASRLIDNAPTINSLCRLCFYMCHQSSIVCTIFLFLIRIMKCVLCKSTPALFLDPLVSSCILFGVKVYFWVMVSCPLKST